MDANRFNMVVGSLIGSFLVFLLLGFFSDLLYGGRGHHDEPLAFAVEVEDSGATEAASEAVDIGALVANADAAAGEKLFKKCSACHKLEDGANGVGPHLYGVVGRQVASVSGYAYSGGLSGMGGTWDLDTLMAFLESPKGMVADTKMTFKGLPDAEDQINLIAYLNEADGSPIELAPAGGGDAASTETAAEPTTEAATETATEPATETATETAAATPEAPAAPAAGGGDFAALLAAADAAAGEKVFKKCRACHKVEDGKNGVGPHLWGVVGRDIGSAEGFNYSDALKGTDGDWSLANLSAYLEDPKGFLPGNKMTFPGLPDAQDRINVITYLNEADGSPEPLQ